MQPDSPASSESGLSPSMEQRAVAVLLVDLRQAWPMLLVRAVLAVALGLVALIWPGITLVILAWAFGIYAAIDGITQIIDGIRRRTQPRWWLSLLLGLLGLVAGAVALVWPGMTAIVLAILVGAWAVVTGVGEVFAAVRQLRSERRGGLLLLAGVLSVVAGVLILVWPVPGAIVLALLIGWFSMLYGIVLAVLGMQLRSAAQSPPGLVSPSA